MGGLLFLRLLAGLLYDLTTAEIRLQLTHVFYSRQTVGNSHSCLYSVLLGRSFSFRPVYPRPSLFFNWNFPHLKSISSFTLKYASLVRPWWVCPPVYVLLYMEKVRAHWKVFFSSLVIRSFSVPIPLSLFPSFCFPSVTTAISNFFTERQDTKFRSNMSNMCMWPVQIWRLW